MTHKHVMVLDGNWFICEGCPARVEVVPRIKPCLEGARVVASVRVRNAGRGGFTLDEIVGLARLWHTVFQNFVDADAAVRPARRARRARRSALGAV
jgi:hypothetical protein